MLYTIVLPEYVLGKALSGFMRARHQAAEQKKIIGNGGDTVAKSFQQQLKSWTISHTMLADLGGFVIDLRDLPLPTAPDHDEKTVPVRDEPEDDHQTQKGKEHRQIVNSLAVEGDMGEWTSSKFEKWAKSPFYALCGDKWVLNAKQLWLAAKVGLIALPNVTERHIQDKSKSNSLVTTLALVQIAQLIAALGSRYTGGISASQLEAVALAHAVCALFTYALQWSCPKDVGVPITTQALRPASREDILAMGREGRARWWWGGMFTSYTIPYMCTPHDSANHDVGTLLGLAIFGAFHLIAWAFAFPTGGERLAWRIASIATAVIPLLILAVMT
ncbi:hypothetical protein INS49_008179 [Diaporthe citri]|uniref:uncharacterized protein n=1 Tax=Diaporthe citri TaxID=83186 RepID=UPI001C7F01CE|nr:uncharacterized protein INS49_008179 [Diaporthe citri]KAG6363084.1 hypothetical protein INS49_008179 [Diaporthe citri]